MNRFKYYLYSALGIGGCVGMAILVFYQSCRELPKATVTIGVEAADFSEPTRAAMDIWNGFVGCELFVQGDDVLVKSDDGEPCGDPWRPESEWDHAATAYRCPGGKSQVLVSRPGNVNTQACIIAHELGHVLKDHGVVHHPIGVMSDGCTTEKQNVLRIRDRDVDALKRAFCEAD